MLPNHHQAEEEIVSAASRHCIVDKGIMTCELVPLIASVCSEQLPVCSASDITPKEGASHADGIPNKAQSKNAGGGDDADRKRPRMGDKGLRDAGSAAPIAPPVPTLTLPGYGQEGDVDACTADEWAAYGMLMDVDDLLEMPCEQVGLQNLLWAGGILSTFGRLNQLIGRSWFACWMIGLSARDVTLGFSRLDH